jgi:hypothetical protein
MDVHQISLVLHHVLNLMFWQVDVDIGEHMVIQIVDTKLISLVN